MQAHTQQASKIQSVKTMSRGKQFACTFFAVLLALFLVPTGAFQPSSAYADEAGTEIAAQSNAATEAKANGAASAKAGAENSAAKATNTEASAAKGDNAQGAATNSTSSADNAGGTANAGNGAAGSTNTTAGAAGSADASGSASAAGNTTTDTAGNATTDSATAGSANAAANASASTAGADSIDGAASGTPASTTPDTGIATQSDIGVGVTVQGTLMIGGASGPNPTTGYLEHDSTFDRGTNKVCIDRSAFDGMAFATLYFQPSWEAGQDAAVEAWNQIPASEKYTASTVQISSGDENIVRALPETFAPEGDGTQDTRMTLAFEAMNPGSTVVYIDYNFTDPNTQVTYQAHLTFPVYVQDAPNAPAQIAVPATSVTAWLDTTLNPPAAGSSQAAYYYEYDGSSFDTKTQEFIVSASTGNENPATYSFDDMFDISIADKSVITAVYNTERIGSDGGLVTGPDAHTYGLAFQAAKAGTTNITISLKQDPSKSVTFAATVRTDHPEVNVPASFDMTMGTSQRIYVADDEASPISIPVLAKQLSWHTSRAKPFVTSITSSNEDVLAVQNITSPSWRVNLAPFELVPVSTGTTTLTLTDCYGKTYTSTVTVKPDGSTNPDVTVNSVELVYADDGSSASKATITVNISDPEGVKLAANIDADGDVTTRWTSSNPDIAEVVTTVDENGDEICQIKPKRASYDDRTQTTADCRITATVNGQVSDYCNIMVEPLEDLCGADPSSPLGAATVTVSKSMPADMLQELQGLSLAISSVAAADKAAVDSATSALEKNGAKLAGVYDIHFINKTDGTEHAWNKPSNPITVKIPLTNSMKELQKVGTLTFYHVDPATGARTKMPTWIDPSQQFVCFETTHFSPFVLVAEPAAQDGDQGDSNQGGNGNQGNNGNNNGSNAGSNSSNTGTDSGAADKANANDKASNDASDDDAAGTTLPKTGDQDSALLVIALMAVAASVLLFGVSRRRRTAAVGVTVQPCAALRHPRSAGRAHRDAHRTATRATVQHTQCRGAHRTAARDLRAV